MIRARRSLIALVALLAIVLAACGSSGGSKSAPKTSSTTGFGAAPSGTIVVGAEQDAACADWIDKCAASSWGAWMMQYQTMPRVFDYAKQGSDWVEVPNVAMAGMPTVTDVGGKQTVTYKISDAAIWSDGEPITSNDIKYTATQLTSGKNVYDPTGYDQIESVATPDPKTAVVTFKKPFASWTQLFSADYGIQPSHLLEGKNRDQLMKNGYSWSGGPWIAKWNKGVSVTLTPNPKFYGTKPTVQKVIFKILADTAAQFQAFKAGELLAIYPQPEPSAIAAIKGGVPGTQAVYTADTANLEAVWMNNSRAPFDNKVVRQAVAYSIDRNAIVKRLFGDIGVEKPMQNLQPPINSRFADPNAWSQYTLNLDKVNSLMTGDGWKKDGSGVWAKGGKTASFTIESTAGNKRRELTEQILQQELQQAGFKMTIANKSADDLFGKILGAGTYQMTIYAQTATSLNPGLCAVACTSAIPTKANGQSGNNLSRISVPAADPLLATVDSNPDVQARITAGKQADRLLGDDQVSIPLDPLPNIVLWSDRIGGPVADNPVLSMFWNMNLWTLKG